MNYLILLTIITINAALKLKLTFGPQQQRCFYQSLTTKQKYSVVVTPVTTGPFEVDIKHEQEGEWKHSVTRRANSSGGNVTLHKYASHDALYSFCFINLATQNLTAKIQIKWGLQLLDLHLLAEQTDQQALQRQAKWIDKSTDKIIQLVNSSNQLVASKQELQHLMRYRLIGFAVIGILTLVVINVYFYHSLKKTFQERKMI